MNVEFTMQTLLVVTLIITYLEISFTYALKLRRPNNHSYILPQILNLSCFYLKLIYIFSNRIIVLIDNNAPSTKYVGTLNISSQSSGD